MKNAKLLLMLLVVSFLLIGCSGNDKDNENNSGNSNAKKSEEETIKKPTDYETVRLMDVSDSHNITFEYPSFSYAPLDDILSMEMEALFEAYKLSVKQDTLASFGIENPYNYFSIEFSDPVITENFISFYLKEYRSTEPGHGMEAVRTINFDLNHNRFLNLYDVLKEHSTNLKVISELVADKLLHDKRFDQYRGNPADEHFKNEVYEVTLPLESHFSDFTLTEDSIVFHNQYYGLFPNAAGIVEIEIKWDEVKKYMKERENNKDTKKEEELKEEGLTYKNKEYGFALTLPASWKGKYSVSEGDWNPAAEKSIDFNFVFDGKEICNIFSISILEGDAAELEVPGPMTIIASKDGKSFAYNTIMEIPPEFSENSQLSQVQDEFLKMVNDDVPLLIESFRFE